MKIMNLVMRLSLLVLALSLIVIVRPTAAQKAPIVLRWSDTNGPQAPLGMLAARFAKLTEEKTKGRVKVELYLSGSLVGYNIEPVQTGVTHFFPLVPSMAVDLVPAISVLDAPYIWKGDAHVYKVTDPRSNFMEAINSQLAKHGLRAVANFEMGFRNLTANKPLYKPEDLKGLKIRSIANPVFMAIVKAMGATPTPMPFPEVATALTTGVIDGQENPIPTIVVNKLHEVQKYIMLTEHVPTHAVIFMNLKAWESLTKEDQENLTNAAIEARDEIVQYQTKMDPEWRSQVKAAGCKIIGTADGLQLESYIKAVKEPVHQQFADKWGDLYQKIIDMGK